MFHDWVSKSWHSFSILSLLMQRFLWNSAVNSPTFSCCQSVLPNQLEATAFLFFSRWVQSVLNLHLGDFSLDFNIPSLRIISTYIWEFFYCFSKKITREISKYLLFKWLLYSMSSYKKIYFSLMVKTTILLWKRFVSVHVFKNIS